MNPVNNQPTLDEIKQVAADSGVPEELLIALWDKETAQGAGLKGKQNHFGPWELTRSTYNSYVTQEAKNKFAGFPKDITAATKEQILAVSAEKLKRDWDAAEGDLNKFLIRWQGNHPTIGLQNVNGITVKQADYSTPIVKYNMERIKEGGQEVKLARSFKDLPEEEQQAAIQFFKTGKFPGPEWKVDTAANTGPTPTPQNKTNLLDFVMTGLANANANASAATTPTRTELAFHSMLAKYNDLATQYATAMTQSPQSIGDVFKYAAFRNYEAPKLEQVLKIMQNQLNSMATLVQSERDFSKRQAVEELRLARTANELERSAFALDKARLEIQAKELDIENSKLRKDITEAKAKMPSSQTPGKGLGPNPPPEFESSIENLNKSRLEYLALNNDPASPEALAARDKYLGAIKNHYDAYNKALAGRLPTNSDLANLAELQLSLGFAKSENASNLPQDSIDRIVSHIRAKGGTIEQAVDSVFGKTDADGIAIKNIVRGKPNAIGQNTKQALMLSDVKDITPHIIKGIDVMPIYKQFVAGEGKKAQLAALLDGKRTEAEKAVAEQQDSKRIASLLTADYSRISTFGTGPLALNRKIGDTIAELRLNTDLFPQLAQMNVDEKQLLPAFTKLINSKVLSIDEAAGQIAQFYSELAKRKDSIARMDKLHVTLPKDWTVAFGKKAIDMTKPSQVSIALRDALIAQQTLSNGIQSMEPGFLLAP